MKSSTHYLKTVSLSAAACVLLVLGVWAASTQIFSEGFTNVPDATYIAGASGQLTGTDETGPWNYAVGADGGVMAIQTDAPYNHHPARTTDGGKSNNNIALNCPLAVPFNIDSVTAVTIEFVVNFSAESPDSNQQVYVDVRNDVDQGGTRCRASLNAETDTPMALVDVGSGADDEFVGATTGITGDTYKVTAKFTKNQPDPGHTSVDYTVENLTHNGTFSVPLTVRDEAAVVPDGTMMNSVQVIFERRVRAWVDDIKISTESGSARVENWRSAN